MTFLENLEPLLVAAQNYAVTQEAWDLMSVRQHSVEISQEMWDKTMNEKFEAIDKLLAAAVEFSKGGKGGNNGGHSS